ncbi:MAG: hypothetical protein ACOYIP_07610 [Coriobacteriales bacterium]
MIFFNIFGFMMMLVFIVIIGIVFFFVSGFQRIKRSFRGDQNPGSDRSSTSTGSSYQRYYTQNANNRSRARARSSSPTSNEVIEIPILEVTDVTDSPEK